MRRRCGPYHFLWSVSVISTKGELLKPHGGRRLHRRAVVRLGYSGRTGNECKGRRSKVDELRVFISVF
jgi:hypothetical protein